MHPTPDTRVPTAAAPASVRVGGQVAAFTAQGLLDSLPGSAAVVDADGVIVAVNESLRRFAGEHGCAPGTAWIGEDYLSSLRPWPAAERVVRAVVGRTATRTEHVYECHSPVSVRWFRMVVTPLEHTLTLVLHIDVTKERLRAAAMIENAPFPMLDLGPDLSARHVTSRWTPYTGKTIAEAEGPGWLDIVATSDQPRVREVLERCVSEMRARSVDARTADDVSKEWMRLAASPYPDGRGRFAGLLVSVVDISRDRRTREQLRHDADHDDLTGLPTRRRFEDHLQGALNGLAGHPGGPGIGLLFIDLDDFKAVNDTHGHEVGDTVIATTAARIAGSLRDGDVACRFGGDEFVVLIARTEGPEEVNEVADRIRESIHAPLHAGGTHLRTRSSVGGVQVRAPLSATEVLRLADEAMYTAKRSGKARSHVHAVDASGGRTTT